MGYSDVVHIRDNVAPQAQLFFCRVTPPEGCLEICLKVVHQNLFFVLGLYADPTPLPWPRLSGFRSYPHLAVEPTAFAATVQQFPLLASSVACSPLGSLSFPALSLCRDLLTVTYSNIGACHNKY